MTTIRHHGGDRYSIRAYIGTDPLTGRPKRRSISFRTDATPSTRAFKAIVRKLEDQLDAELEGRAAAGSIGELVADWLTLAERDRSPSTLRMSYRPRAKLIAERFGTTPAAELRARDIDAWYTALMQSGKTASTVQELHRVFSAILQFGVDKDRLPKAVTRQVTLPKHIKPDITPPSPATMRAVWERLPDAAWGRAIRLLAATGMRRGEVVGLRWEDWRGGEIEVKRSVIEIAGGGVVVKEPKGKRSRTVLLGRVAQDVLTAQQAVTTGPWVFPGARGLPARPGWISTMWNRWRAPNGAPGVRVHDLRHFYATFALEGGAPVASVSKQLGHAKVTTTLDIYASHTDAGQQLAADAIDRALTP